MSQQPNFFDVVAACTFSGALGWFAWYSVIGIYALIFDKAKLDEPAKYLGPLFMVMFLAVVFGVLNQQGRS